MTRSDSESILIAGASVRAAVQSAQRAGLKSVIAADLFQDHDLGTAIRCRLSHGYANLPHLAKRMRPAAWMYTGALENQPELVGAIDVPLLGCSPDVLCDVRDPWKWSAALRDAGIPVSPLAKSIKGLPLDGTWLRKRLASAAGRHVAIVDSQLPRIDTSAESPVYYQRRVVGHPVSAVFVAAGGRCRFLAASRQLVGWGDPTAGPFQYLGSIGPIALARLRMDQWQSMGDALARRFRLVGLFGVDAIDDGRTYVPVEVNPRYTASVELLEHCWGINAWQIHWNACRAGDLNFKLPKAQAKIMGKRTVFASRDIQVGAEFLAWVETQEAAVDYPRFADIPAKPDFFPRGSPLLTVFTEPAVASEILGIEADLKAAVHRAEQSAAQLSKG